MSDLTSVSVCETETRTGELTLANISFMAGPEIAAALPLAVLMFLGSGEANPDTWEDFAILLGVEALFKLCMICLSLFWVWITSWFLFFSMRRCSWLLRSKRLAISDVVFSFLRSFDISLILALLESLCFCVCVRSSCSMRIFSPKQSDKCVRMKKSRGNAYSSKLLL